MSENSAIQWTDHTFNPVRGCTMVSPGCANCYAARDAKRFPNIRGIWGDSGTRIVAVPDSWKSPLKWHKASYGFVECQVCRWRGDMHESKESTGSVMHCPTCNTVGSLRANKRPRVFCASLADVFEDWKGVLHFPDHLSPDGKVLARWEGIQMIRTYDERFPLATMDHVRQELFELIEATPSLDWLLLTKRPENVMRMVPESWMDGFPPNVWMGTTVEDQQRADERIPLLLDIPARVRFLSCEPLLGPVKIDHIRIGDNQWFPMQHLHWVITGGESGPKCRTANVDWFRSLRDQCSAAGVPFFMKQLGGVKDHRGNLEDFSDDLRVREFPTVEGIA